jgi:hypothetical protein
MESGFYSTHQSILTRTNFITLFYELLSERLTNTVDIVHYLDVLSGVVE